MFDVSVITVFDIDCSLRMTPRSNVSGVSGAGNTGTGSGNVSSLRFAAVPSASTSASPFGCEGEDEGVGRVWVKGGGEGEGYGGPGREVQGGDGGGGGGDIG